MLPNVPRQINTAARAVTLRHPQSIPCVVFRKAVARTDDPPGQLGSLPTLGGIGVLSSEDESTFDWDALGEGKILFTGTFPGSSQAERADGLVPVPEVEALVEAVAAIDSPAYFVPRRNDVIYVLIGQDVHLPYEITAIEGNVNIAPYTRRFVLQARDDLAFLADTVTEGLGRAPQG